MRCAFDLSAILYLALRFQPRFRPLPRPSRSTRSTSAIGIRRRPNKYTVFNSPASAARLSVSLLMSQRSSSSEKPNNVRIGATAVARNLDPSKPQKSWRTAWRNLTKKAGLPGLRFHDLRHHAITELAESQTSDAVIMGIAGHVSKKMLEHYSHARL